MDGCYLKTIRKIAIDCWSGGDDVSIGEACRDFGFIQIDDACLNPGKHKLVLNDTVHIVTSCILLQG